MSFRVYVLNLLKNLLFLRGSGPRKLPRDVGDVSYYRESFLATRATFRTTAKASSRRGRRFVPPRKLPRDAGDVSYPRESFLATQATFRTPAKASSRRGDQNVTFSDIVIENGFGYVLPGYSGSRPVKALSPQPFLMVATLSARKAIRARCNRSLSAKLFGTV